MSGRVAGIYIHANKGDSPEPVESVRAAKSGAAA